MYSVIKNLLKALVQVVDEIDQKTVVELVAQVVYADILVIIKVIIDVLPYTKVDFVLKVVVVIS